MTIDSKEQLHRVEPKQTITKHTTSRFLKQKQNDKVEEKNCTVLQLCSQTGCQKPWSKFLIKWIPEHRKRHR